ncbi:hypothetical protein Scep_014507 [Stephania cephalantha]|uniref:Uncharacterized protein n=1 Tax=Stephania cephalantha TaxID=152367 RepID=A0AAP0J1C0_9MAGN
MIPETRSRRSRGDQWLRRKSSGKRKRMRESPKKRKRQKRARRAEVRRRGDGGAGPSNAARVRAAATHTSGGGRCTREATSDDAAMTSLGSGSGVTGAADRKEGEAAADLEKGEAATTNNATVVAHLAVDRAGVLERGDGAATTHGLSGGGGGDDDVDGGGDGSPATLRQEMVLQGVTIEMGLEGGGGEKMSVADLSLFSDRSTTNYMYIMHLTCICIIFRHSHTPPPPSSSSSPFDYHPHDHEVAATTVAARSIGGKYRACNGDALAWSIVTTVVAANTTATAVAADFR